MATKRRASSTHVMANVDICTVVASRNRRAREETLLRRTLLQWHQRTGHRRCGSTFRWGLQKERHCANLSSSQRRKQAHRIIRHWQQRSVLRRSGFVRSRLIGDGRIRIVRGSTNEEDDRKNNGEQNNDRHCQGGGNKLHIEGYNALSQQYRMTHPRTLQMLLLHTATTWADTEPARGATTFCSTAREIALSHVNGSEVYFAPTAPTFLPAAPPCDASLY